MSAAGVLLKPWEDGSLGISGERIPSPPPQAPFQMGCHQLTVGGSVLRSGRPPARLTDVGAIAGGAIDLLRSAEGGSILAALLPVPDQELGFVPAGSFFAVGKSPYRDILCCLGGGRRGSRDSGEHPVIGNIRQLRCWGGIRRQMATKLGEEEAGRERKGHRGTERQTVGEGERKRKRRMVDEPITADSMQEFAARINLEAWQGRKSSEWEKVGGGFAARGATTGRVLTPLLSVGQPNGRRASKGRRPESRGHLGLREAGQAPPPQLAAPPSRVDFPRDPQSLRPPYA